MSRFLLTIDAPGVGWLPLHLTIGDDTIDVAASNVLNDPLAELADVAVAMGHRDALEARVGLWLEPEWLHLRFDADAGADIVEVSLHDRGGRRRVAGTRAGREVVRAELLHALWRLASGAPRDGRLEGWPSFPWAQLRKASGADVDVHRLGLRPPWRVFAGGARHEAELRRELRRSHPLHGVAVTVLAINDDTDEYLLALATGVDAYATVALTWDGRPSDDPTLPRTTLYRSLEEWRRAHVLDPR
jgi:hypothetical protein